MAELIATGDTLNTGRIAINNWYSGSTNLWSAGTGASSIKSVSGNSTASGAFTLSAGKSNLNSGPYGITLNGKSNNNSGTYGVSINGTGNTISGSFGVIINGRFNSAGGSRSLIGNGTSNNASNQYSTIFNGTNHLASGLRSVVINGSGNQARSTYAFVGNGSSNLTIAAAVEWPTILNGQGNQANAKAATVINGLANTASGLYSLSLNGVGNTASGQFSLTHGYSCTAAFTHSAAIGSGAIAGGTYQTVFAAAAGNTIRLRYSDGTGSFEGGTNVGPADYAEYFEWADGNPNSNDRYGYGVSLVEDGKVKVGGKNIIGIVSPTPAIAGDSSEFSWKDKYLTDEWGIKIQEEFKTFYSKVLNKKVFVDKFNVQYVGIPNSDEAKEKNRIAQVEIPEGTEMETISIAKLHPEYKIDSGYVPRSQRKEWTTIGLLGKLKVRTIEKITGKYIDINESGLGINGTTYPILKTIKDYDNKFGIVLVFFK